MVVTKYNARAVRWEHGWELHVAYVGITQVRTLGNAEQQVRDLVQTMVPDAVMSADDIQIVVSLDGEDLDVTEVRALNQQVQRDLREAAHQSRALVRNLRGHGVSVSDSAALLGVSRGRISQLLKDGSTTTPTEVGKGA